MTPINNHILIEPLVHESFIASQKDQYEEIGVVVSFDARLNKLFAGFDKPSETLIHVGDKVYFDSWLAAKYPKGDGTQDFYWLVKYEDVRAIEYVEPTIPA